MTAIVDPRLEWSLDRPPCAREGCGHTGAHGGRQHLGRCGNCGCPAYEPPVRHEGRCDRCGGANPVWYAPSPLWNRVMRTDGVDLYPFCCPSCFARLAEMCGAVSDRTVWSFTAEDWAVPE